MIVKGCSGMTMNDIMKEYRNDFDNICTTKDLSRQTYDKIMDLTFQYFVRILFFGGWLNNEIHSN